jgi:hypothetical protein
VHRVTTDQSDANASAPTAPVAATEQVEQVESVELVRAGRFAAVVAAIVAGGSLIGVAWWVFAPVVVGVYTGVGIFPRETEPGGFVAADVHFAFWTAAYGLVVALNVRRRTPEHPVLGVSVVLLGTLGAGALAALVGGALGPDASPDVQVGALARSPLEVQAVGWLLIGPIVALALWFVLDLVHAWRFADDEDIDGDLTVARDPQGPSDEGLDSIADAPPLSATSVSEQRSAQSPPL